MKRIAATPRHAAMSSLVALSTHCFEVVETRWYSLLLCFFVVFSCNFCATSLRLCIIVAVRMMTVGQKVGAVKPTTRLILPTPSILLQHLYKALMMMRWGL